MQHKVSTGAVSGLPSSPSDGTSPYDPGDFVSAPAISAGLALSPETVTLPGSGLVFNNTYGTAVTAAYRSAVITAENFLQSHFTNSGTFTLNFDLQSLSPGYSARNNWNNAVTVSFTALVNALTTHASTADDLAAVKSLPATDPSSGKGFMIPVGMAEVLGLRGPSTGTDDSIVLNSNFQWSYGQDAVGDLLHEISEGIMGRIGGLGYQNSAWGPLDLFRYSASGQRDYTGGQDGLPAYFSIDGTTLLTQFADPVSTTGAYSGSDVADWINTQNDAFGPGGPSEPGTISNTDIRVLDILGWTPVETPPVVTATNTPIATGVANPLLANVSPGIAGDPVSVKLVSDSDFTSGSSLTLDNGALTYQPGTISNANIGSDSLTYTVTDITNGATITKTQSVTLANWANVADATSGVTSNVAMTRYSGPVDYLVNEYAVNTNDTINVTPQAPNTYVVVDGTGGGRPTLGGINVSAANGDNVLDSYANSVFDTDGSGQDHNYMDCRNLTQNQWDTVVDFKAGDNITLWGITPQDFSFSWIGDTQGAPGATGLTGVFAPDNGGSAAGFTLAGFTLADQGSVAVDYNTINGTPYASVHVITLA